MRLLISAGPTREPLDPVRFLTNRSTGKMGYALAEAGIRLGFETVLVSGPVALTPPAGLASFHPIETAAQMAEQMKREARTADWIIMCAAVADFRPLCCAEQKIKKHGNHLLLELEPTEDILLSLGKQKKPGQVLVGFAAETEDLEANALDKLHRKNLDWIAANQVGVPGRGFGADTNAVTLFSVRGERITLALESKKILAEQILHIIQKHAEGN